MFVPHAASGFEHVFISSYLVHVQIILYHFILSQVIISYTG